MGQVEFDDYPTPQPLADEMVKFLFELFPQKKHIIEPASGSGNILRPARQLWTGEDVKFVGCDILSKFAVEIAQLGVPFVHADFLTYVEALAQAGWLGPDALVPSNPPYGQDYPQRFIEAISHLAQPGCHIAFLLRQSFLGGIGRALEFKERKSLRIKRDIAGRPKFNPASKHQDHSEYAVYIYEVGYRGHYLGWEDPLVWKPSHLKKLEKLKKAEQLQLVAPAQMATTM